MPRGRIAVMLVCAALAGVFAYLGWGAVHPAKSAHVASSTAVSTHEHVRTPPRLARHPAPASRAEQARKPRHASPRPARRRPSPYRIAFFGDSVSVGFGASDRRHGYVARVSSWLGTHGKRVIETVDAKGGVPVAFWEYVRMPRQLDAAVVELGTNDVRLGTPWARFAQEYRTLTSRIRAASPRVQLLCLSVLSQPGGASLDAVINEQVRAVCPGTYVDITRLGDRPDLRSGDGFHPNDVGYRLIAQAVVSRLKTR